MRETTSKHLVSSRQGERSRPSGRSRSTAASNAADKDDLDRKDRRPAGDKTAPARPARGAGKKRSEEGEKTSRRPGKPSRPAGREDGQSRRSDKSGKPEGGPSRRADRSGKPEGGQSRRTDRSGKPEGGSSRRADKSGKPEGGSSRRADKSGKPEGGRGRRSDGAAGSDDRPVGRSDNPRAPAGRAGGRSEKPAGAGERPAGRPTRPEEGEPRRSGKPGRAEEAARENRERGAEAGSGGGQAPGPGDVAELPEDILPGRKAVLDLLRTAPRRVDAVMVRQGLRGRDVMEILDLCRAEGVRFRLAGAGELDRVWPGNHQGVLAKVFEAGFSSLEELAQAAMAAPLPVILALDRVQDPGNLGTLARTLYGLGGGGILMPKHESARLGPGAFKASAGALAKLPVCKFPNLARGLSDLAESGFTLVCAVDLPEAESVYTATPRFPAVLVLGGEEGGARPCVAKRCGQLWRVPLLGDMESLNVAQAGAIMLGRLAQARLA